MEQVTGGEVVSEKITVIDEGPETITTAAEAPVETAPLPILDGNYVQRFESWTNFTEKTTIHGLRYIFQKPGVRFRRRIWSSVVITAMSVFIIQVGIRTGNYLEYKTTLDVGVFYKDHLEFPAITICNQNRHRTTAVVENGLYDVVDEVFKRSSVSNIPWEKFGERVHGIDYGDFTLQTGHEKHIFIDSCTWNGIDCDIDNDFKAVLTDLGLCYTFNSQQNTKRLYTAKAGAGSGLKLVINVEQYEYMRGPQDDAGIKIVLHPPEETPIMQEQGFAAAPGSHTLVSLKRLDVTTLQPPYGICHPNNPSVSQCHAQCQARDIINTCKCQTAYMQPIIKNATIACDFKTSLSCVRQALAEMTKSEWQCACRPPCKQVHYKPQLSYAQLSKFNIDRMILDNPEKQKILERSYLKVLYKMYVTLTEMTVHKNGIFQARETNQRHREDIKVKDTTDMTRLVSLADRLQHMLQSIHEKTTDPLTTAHHYNLPAIIVPQPLERDIATITNKVTELSEDRPYSRFNYFINYVLSYIVFTEETFLERHENVFRFPQLLSYCLQELTTVQQNDSFDGSGDVDLDSLNKRCKTQIQIKKDWLGSDFTYPNIQGYESSYKTIVASIFENSTKSPDASNYHNACLHVLGLELQETFPELIRSFANFTKVQTLEDYIWITNKIIITWEVLNGARYNLTQCRWLKEAIEDIRVQLKENGDHALKSNAILTSSFDTMSETVVSMNRDFESLGKPIFEMIIAYMIENVTKLELARHMISTLTTKAIVKLAEFESNGNIVTRSLKEKLTHFKNSITATYAIIAKSPVPILNVQQIQSLEFFKLAYDTNRTEFQHLIDGLPENMTNVQELLDLVFSEYQLSFQRCLEAIPGAFKEISDHLAMLREELQTYAESSSLNVIFFMENFLQLDIFYKDMSYQVITQQEAFGLLSLLGEVGGFLGLLLGASVITVCELIDYLLLNAARHCARHRKKDPDVCNVESAEERSE